MPLSTVYSKEGKPVTFAHIPSVMRFSPIRPDVVQFVHSNISKNSRQPYARYNRAGHQHSAESWGTGRAVARVPRISGSGTSRNGQAAFANMTRGGRMFSPLKVWRRWHRLVNISQKRYAMCSALAASSVPALVMARGHKIEKVPEIPLVVSDDVEQIKKTKEAVAILKALKASDDVQRSADSRKIRAGKGKMRNRRHVQRRGLLVVHNKEEGLTRAFRNISGVKCANVNHLSIRDLAPGGHFGRFILWTEGAFKKLDQLYGTTTRDAQLKKGYRHPIAPMTTTDLNRIVFSHKVQACMRPKRERLIHLPSIRKELLLTRKIRRSTIKNSHVRQARKARLDKLRAAGKLPAKKEKGPVTKRTNHVDVYGRPVTKKEKRERIRKVKERKKQQKADTKKARMDRIAKAIEDAKARRAKNKKLMEEKAKQPKAKKEKKRKPKTKGQIRKMKANRPKGPSPRKPMLAPKPHYSQREVKVRLAKFRKARKAFAIAHKNDPKSKKGTKKNESKKTASK